ncbi:hypothetical protein KBD61_05760 [Patescibacteria group bacterium]|nr:hypothetical protein [Patescibacteria group bacterium]
MTDERYSRLRFLQGQSLDDCFVLVEYSLYEDFKDTEEMEWSLIHLFEGTRLPFLTGPGEADSLWVSPAGTIYLVARTNEGYGLHVGRPSTDGYVWRLQETVRSETTFVREAWGVSENEVICWGGGILTPSPPSDSGLPPVQLDLPTCWIGSGDTWMQHPGPGWVHGMGGRRIDDLVAVGNHGLIAYWDGTQWEKDLAQLSMDMSFVQVTPSGEIYGASYYGRVFKRTDTGWKEVGVQMGSIYGMVQWQGKILIATGYGLHRVEGNEIVIEQPHIDVRRIWAGKTLLWSDEVAVHEIGGAAERSILCKEIFGHKETL